jgi:small-conductance mechanosensitive channel
MFARFIANAAELLPLLLTGAAVAVILAFSNWYLRRRWRDDAGAQFQFQLIMLSLTLAGLIALLVALPIGDNLRGQLLSLLGILLSAAIALSSTTFIGNIMAGIMLRAVRSARPGDFITVADLVGRITEMGLLHTEIQTEQRDLVTVPNLYMVTQPMKVVRASGTIITASLSLGYELSHARVQPLLREATERAGLREGFVQVVELGDFSVVYRASGLLEDVKSLITARSALREAMLDVLHEAGIEIVSPNFMNTRSIDPEVRMIPVRTAAGPDSRSGMPQTAMEDIAFDKADEAASVEEIRKAIQKTEADLSALNEADETVPKVRRTRLELRLKSLGERLATAEAQLRAEAAAGD